MNLYIGERLEIIQFPGPTYRRKASFAQCFAYSGWGEHVKTHGKLPTSFDNAPEKLPKNFYKSLKSFQKFQQSSQKASKKL